MLDSIAYYLVKGLNKLLHVLPMGAALALGRFGGHVVYLLSGKRKRITYANLKAAFFAEKSPRELAMITKNVYLNVGQVFGELLALTKTDKEYYDKYIKVHNFDRILEASKNPNGMILVSAHFGNWELVSAKAFTVGIPLHLLARDQKMAKLNELLNQLRESKGSKVVRKGMDVKKVFRILRSGGSLGLLGDQNAGVNGVLVDFFGRPASAAVGPYRFGQKSGAWVVPAFVYRTKGQYHEVVIEEPMKIEQGMDIEPFIKKYNECLEKQIRINPGQWFWMHKRWKATTMKKILVLDDGKKGHLKQSLSVVREIRRYRRDKGLDDSQTPVEIVKVIFKGRFHRTLLAAVSPFIAKYSQGSLSWLKWALDAESYKRLESLYADIIVSAGSALAGVNLIMKCENNARSVAVLDPGPMKRKKFDIVVVPAHDALKFKPADNTVVTELAPNLIDPEALAIFSGEALLSKKGPCVGLLLGGENSFFTLGKDRARQAALEAAKAAEALKGCFRVTTSRRTLDEADAGVAEAVSSHPRSLGVVIGKNDADPHTVEKILTASDVVIVSGESISMVSEAVSSGKPVLVFMPEKRVKGITKYDGFVDSLAKKGFLKKVETHRIAEEAVRVIGDKVSFAVPDDAKCIREKLYRLF